MAIIDSIKNFRDGFRRHSAGGFSSVSHSTAKIELFWQTGFCLIAIVILLTVPPFALGYSVEQHNDDVIGQYVLSPTKYELDMNPGEKANRELIVANRTGQTITLEFSTEDFEGSQDPSEATVFLGNEASDYSARGWIKPEVNSIVLQQGETLTMNVEVNVPLGAEPGGHYASLFASTTIASQQDGSAVNITSRLGCLFLIRVSGRTIEEGTLSTPEIQGFSEYGPVEMGLVFHNSGNIHLKPSGRIMITNFLGQTVAEIPVKEWVVLPDAARRTTAEWETRFQLGRYTATAEINYGNGAVQLVESRSFWVIPWKILLAVGAGVVLIVALVTVIVRRRRSRQREYDDELKSLRDQAARATGEPTVQQTDSVPLNELFPSMHDSRSINLLDPDIQMLVGELIGHQIDLSRSYLAQGEVAEAQQLLTEARFAAQRARLYALVGVIDDLI